MKYMLLNVISDCFVGICFVNVIDQNLLPYSQTNPFLYWDQVGAVKDIKTGI